MKPKTKKQLIEAIVVLAIILAVAMLSRSRWLPQPADGPNVQVTPTVQESEAVE